MRQEIKRDISEGTITENKKKKKVKIEINVLRSPVKAQCILQLTKIIGR